MRVLCAIPARGGSKGIPGKNLRTVAGIPLVGHAILAARAFSASQPDDACAIVVDTDDETIAVEARRWGARVPFLRDPALATDEASTADCVIALLERLEAQSEAFDIVVLLQPTSPLRDASDIIACWAPVAGAVAPSAVSVVRQEHPAEHGVSVDARGRFHWA